MRIALAVFLGILVVVGVVPPGIAAPITLQQARTATHVFIARTFPASTSANARSKTVIGTSEHSVKGVEAISESGTTIGFVSHLEPGGYVLLRADDEVPAVKLYSDTGAFTHLPPQFLRVIKAELAGELTALSRHKAKGASVSPREDWATLLQSPPAAPSRPTRTKEALPNTVLLQTTWNQDDPYNYYSPAAAQGPGNRAFAGCVACAMAQILRYHKRPVRITSDESYTDNEGDCKGTHRMSDAGLGDYAWTNMPVSISGASLLSYQKAVGQLIYHCGVATKMNFEADASGASPTEVPGAFSRCFGFSSSALTGRSNFSQVAWYSIIASNIDAHQPVFYGFYSYTTPGGHAVVCDGYRNDSDIHLNFGWSGAWNAWYNMDVVVAPDDIWIDHTAIFGIGPLPGRPVIKTQPQSVVAVRGTNVSFTVEALGYPLPLYQWRFNSVPISGANSQTLVITNIQATNGGNYSVVVSNSAGSVTSAIAALVVKLPVEIIRHPESMTVVAGTNANFLVIASGTPPLYYQWRKNQTELLGATNAALSFASVGANDAADYTVCVRNSYGTVTSAVARLTVLSTPWIVQQPSSILVTVCSTIRLTVEATSVAALSYQWERDGLNITNGVGVSGATQSTLVITNASLLDSGTYGVVITNLAGATRSAPALVTVSNLQGTLTATPSTFLFGTNASSCTVNISCICWYSRWVVSNTNDWVSVLSGGSGFGAGAVQLGVAKNNGESWRTANLDIGGTAITIRQGGTDQGKPTVGITWPTSGTIVRDALVVARGTAADNVGLGSVLFQANGMSWSRATGTSNWQAEFPVSIGNNSLRLYAEDVAGNRSSTSSVAFVFAPGARLVVTNIGSGVLTPDYRNVVLDVGKGYSMTATGSNGHRFDRWMVSTNWGPGAVVTNRTLAFVMHSNLTLTVVFLDTNRPTVTVSNPAGSQRISNTVYTARGKASDNVAVDSVWYRVNGDVPWLPAEGTAVGRTSLWSAPLALDRRTNTFQVYAQDAAGNLSPTSAVTFICVMTAPMVVQAAGKGTLNPNYNGQLLEIGNAYSMTASSATGYAFTNWTDGGVAVVTNSPTVRFIMRSNLVLQANFNDVQKPVVAISAPSANARISNAVVTVRGYVSDNGPMGTLWHQYGGGAWHSTPALGTNWSVGLMLLSGTNLFRICARDAAGNVSLTNSRALVCTLPPPALTNVFRISSLIRTNSSWQLRLSEGAWGSSQVVEGSSNLVEWRSVFTNTSTNSRFDFLDRQATNALRRFYRVVLP